ncbi:MAG: FecR family protein [Candidatus Riflebacteria bacterium]|nr:FecR family protein [Candidatus Riflebacteria bacterium]
MSNSENEKLCQDCLESVLNRQSPDSRTLQHMQSCDGCRQTIATIELLKREDSAYGDESHPELKLKLIKKLAPIVTARSEVPKASLATSFAWLWKLSIAVIVLVAAWSTLTTQSTTVIKPPAGTPQIASLPQQYTFTLSLNGGESQQVSMDNPVALFANDSGEITLPDRSRLLVKGPARLTLAPRGFHLLQGHVRAEVTRGMGEFVATTPHGIVTVLGTVFVCESYSRYTTVEVLSGKVRVSSDHAPATVLGPGEKSRMGQQKASSSETETIPSLDSE